MSIAENWGQSKKHVHIAVLSAGAVWMQRVVLWSKHLSGLEDRADVRKDAIS